MLLRSTRATHRRAPAPLCAAVLLTVALLTGGAHPAVAAGGLHLQGVTVDGRTDPSAVEAEHPLLGWKLTSEERNATQSAYQVPMNGECCTTPTT